MTPDATPISTAQEISAVCKEVETMLLSKNASYGDSAQNPIRIFSRATPIEGINVRLDDKLSRIACGKEDSFAEEPEWDLIGYFIHRIIAKRRLKGKQ